MKAMKENNAAHDSDDAVVSMETYTSMNGT